METTIQAERLSKRFGDTEALRGLDLTAEAGTVTAVLGPNGAGKSTLVRAIATLIRPDAGRLSVLGHDVAREPERVRQLIGLAGQFAAVEPAMSGRENLEMVGRLYGKSRGEARVGAERVLGQLNLLEPAGRLVRTYSGGMRRRLDLGASLVGEPRLLLLDEPTTGLDPRSRIELQDAIRSLVADGTDVLLTTQYLEEADQLAGQIAIVDHGRAIAEGTPAELKRMAGGGVIEVRPERADQLVLTAEALGRLGGGSPQIEEATRSVTVGVEGSGSLPSAVKALDAAGIRIEDMALRQPTLDEVFLALTGRSATETRDDSRPTLAAA